MAGSIRAFLGFMLCWGAVGGIDNNNALLPCMAFALVGLGIMYNGVLAMNRLNS